ncbi:DNA polymerase III, clamp loader complex, gamma/delta/delta subunit [Dimargaris cristalligena]|uniref:DNA polymerase III, clamp loader complex, gamma/delta/delta subunit n=1 Tax=Dimargaris cristalligena TaxID=215637 RepID=A0A4P9ZZ23_9FUNG|nr:DNA polymerase III, clamp loader complex, gamma/delta/delta subunit [Dimargaris cristalligena]|eukprot:RKP38937.1 DNA polymerase III, clamp loader complex, gamma/delta/delta subunit [Dimargaris cristalligena]
MATGPHQPSLARAKSNGSSQAPLAELMRPQTLDEIYGQDELVGPQGILRTLITQRGRIPSLILWGPPGTGKTTLARIMARSVQAYFRELSAVSQGLADVKKILEEAQQTTKYTRRPIVLFIDEIHRFNKAQQDFFLPFVERGTVTLIGATTENPSFKVNNALLSRTRVLVLKEICPEVMINILKRAAALKEGGTSHVPPPQETLNCIAQLSNGDARTAINTLDMALDIQTGPELTVQDVKNALQRTHLFYDRDGDEHYNIISAFHKSIRGSDANATLYWLGRMLVGGEDPLYVARRMIRIASEDVGLADPQALPIAVAAYQSAQFIGMPECDTVLAEVAVYLARAPKSVEVYAAYKRVKEAIASEGQTQQVPLHLRNAPTRLMADLGYAKDYKYNPDYEGPVQQDYLPPELLGCNFFQD